jgi:hypothetical protein
MAVLDWNRDGKTDFVATDLETSVILGENNTDSPNHSLRLRLVGTKSSRDAIGTKVHVSTRGGETRRLQLTAGDGYESSNERVLRVGVGSLDSVERITIHWPSGETSHSENLSVDHEWLVIEGVSKWHAR